MPPVTFVVGFEEFRAAARAKAATGGFGHARRYAVVLGLYLVGLMAWILIDQGAAGVAAGILAVDLFFRHVVLRLLYRRYAIAEQPVTVTFAPDGLKWSGPGFGVSFDGSKIKKVHARRDHLTLFVSRNEALPIPRRAVGSDGEFDALARFAREHAVG